MCRAWNIADSRWWSQMKFAEGIILLKWNKETSQVAVLLAPDWSTSVCQFRGHRPMAGCWDSCPVTLRYRWGLFSTTQTQSIRAECRQAGLSKESRSNNEPDWKSTPDYTGANISKWAQHKRQLLHRNWATDGDNCARVVAGWQKKKSLRDGDIRQQLGAWHCCNNLELRLFSTVWADVCRCIFLQHLAPVSVGQRSGCSPTHIHQGILVSVF